MSARDCCAVRLQFAMTLRKVFISIFQNGRGEVAQSPLSHPAFSAIAMAKAGVNPVTHEWLNGAPRDGAVSNRQGAC